jgi:hypothetical protein
VIAYTQEENSAEWRHNAAVTVSHLIGLAKLERPRVSRLLLSFCCCSISSTPFREFTRFRGLGHDIAAMYMQRQQHSSRAQILPPQPAHHSAPVSRAACGSAAAESCLHAPLLKGWVCEAKHSRTSVHARFIKTSEHRAASNYNMSTLAMQVASIDLVTWCSRGCRAVCSAIAAPYWPLLSSSHSRLPDGDPLMSRMCIQQLRLYPDFTEAACRFEWPPIGSLQTRQAARLWPGDRSC